MMAFDSHSVNMEPTSQHSTAIIVFTKAKGEKKGSRRDPVGWCLNPGVAGLDVWATLELRCGDTWHGITYSQMEIQHVRRAFSENVPAVVMSWIYRSSINIGLILMLDWVSTTRKLASGPILGVDLVLSILDYHFCFHTCIVISD